MKKYRDIYPGTMPHRAVAVYMYLCDRANYEDHTCYPGIKTIARDLSLSVSTVKRGLKDLEEKKYIQKDQRYRPNGGYSSNLYTLL